MYNGTVNRLNIFIELSISQITMFMVLTKAGRSFIKIVNNKDRGYSFLFWHAAGSERPFVSVALRVRLYACLLSFRLFVAVAVYLSSPPDFTFLSG